MKTFGFVEDTFQALQFKGQIGEMAEFLGEKAEDITVDFVEMVDGTGCLVQWPPETWFLKFDDGDVIPMDGSTFGLICYDTEVDG